MFYAVKGENELACLLDGSNGVNFPSPVFVSYLPSLFFFPGPVFFLLCYTYYKAVMSDLSVSPVFFSLFFLYISIHILPP